MQTTEALSRSSCGTKDPNHFPSPKETTPSPKSLSSRSPHPPSRSPQNLTRLTAKKEDLDPPTKSSSSLPWKWNKHFKKKTPHSCVNYRSKDTCWSMTKTPALPLCSRNSKTSFQKNSQQNYHPLKTLTTASS